MRTVAEAVRDGHPERPRALDDAEALVGAVGKQLHFRSLASVGVWPGGICLVGGGPTRDVSMAIAEAAWP